MADTPRFIRNQNTGQVYDISGGFLDYIPSAQEFTKRSGSSDIGANSLAVANPQQYLTDLFTQQAQARLLPQQDLALQGIDLSRQDINQQETDVNRNYDELGRQLAEAATNARGKFTEDQNNFGLLSSGLTAAGLGRIASDTARSQQMSAQDRASQLAKLALQRAGLATQEAQVKQQTAQGINDLVSQLIAGSRDAEAKAKAAKQSQTLDLGNRIVVLDEDGNITKSYAKGSLSGGGSATKLNGSTLLEDVQAAAPFIVAGAEVGTPQSREGLIQALATKYAGVTGIKPIDIANAVYGTIRQPGEGAYNGPSQSTLDFVKNLGGGPTLTASQQKEQSLINSAQTALNSLKSASAAINKSGTSFNPTQTVSGYIGKTFGTDKNAIELTNTGLALASIAKSLGDSGVLSDQDITRITNSLPKITDSQLAAQTKIAQLETLLNARLGKAGAAAPTDLRAKYNY